MIIANTSNQHKSYGIGGVLVAGNANSGSSIPFRMGDKQLKEKIDSFRDEYQDGSKGMVTWPRFCAYIGYSIDEVMECVVRGREGNNAYSNRGEMLTRFRTEVKAMTLETADGKISLARDEAGTDYLNPPGSEKQLDVVRIQFGNGDGQWIGAMK